MIPVVVIMGPTAVGKSDLAVEIAERFEGEVINADSMQVYKYLRIGTAAPTKEMLQRVPHHLFGVLELTEHPDAGWYAKNASTIAQRLWSRGRLPVIVGGTFFWIKVLLEGIAEIPKVPRIDPSRFKDIYAELKRVDPELASRLHPSDTQRILRGLEVFYGTGRPLSWFHKQGIRRFGDFRPLKIWVDMPREELYTRINERFDRMLQEGLVQEVKWVLDQGYSPDIPPLRNGSYRYVVSYVLGRLDYETMRAKTAQEHRNYARRQLVWLRREYREKKLTKVQAESAEAFRLVETHMRSEE